MFFVRLATHHFLGINGLQTHFAHEAADMVAADHDLVVGLKRDAHPTGPIEGIGGVYFVERIHNTNVFGAHRRLVVEATSRNADEFGLATDGNRRMSRVDERPFILNAQIV